MLTSWDAGRNMPVQQRVDILQYAKGVLAFARSRGVEPVPFDVSDHTRCSDCACPLLRGHFVLAWDVFTVDGGQYTHFYCFECLEAEYLGNYPFVTPPVGIEEFRDRGQFYTVEGVGR